MYLFVLVSYLALLLSVSAPVAKEKQSTDNLNSDLLVVKKKQFNPEANFRTTTRRILNPKDPRANLDVPPRCRPPAKWTGYSCEVPFRAKPTGNR